MGRYPSGRALLAPGVVGLHLWWGGTTASNPPSQRPKSPRSNGANLSPFALNCEPPHRFPISPPPAPACRDFTIEPTADTFKRHSLARTWLRPVLGFALFASHDAIIKSLGETYSVFQIIFFGVLFAFVPMALMMLTDRGRRQFQTPSSVADPFALRADDRVDDQRILRICDAAADRGLFLAFCGPAAGHGAFRFRCWARLFEPDAGLLLEVGLVGVIIVLRPGVSEFTLGHLAALTAACTSADRSDRHSQNRQRGTLGCSDTLSNAFVPVGHGRDASVRLRAGRPAASRPDGDGRFDFHSCPVVHHRGLSVRAWLPSLLRPSTVRSFGQPHSVPFSFPSGPTFSSP